MRTNIPKSKYGAKKVVAYGITFDSKLEKFMWDLLTENNIKFKYQVRFILQEKFSYAGENIQEIAIIPDFYIIDHNILLDTKGLQTPDNKIKWKMLKSQLTNDNSEPRIVFVHTQKGAREFIFHLLNGFTEQIEQRFISGRIKKLKKYLKLRGGSFLLPSGDSVLRVQDLTTMPNYDFNQLLKKYA
jgi:hypothetical protein